MLRAWQLALLVAAAFQLFVHGDPKHLPPGWQLHAVTRCDSAVLVCKIFLQGASASAMLCEE